MEERPDGHERRLEAGREGLKGGCKAGNPTACAMKYGNYFSPIQEQFDRLLLNQGQHYLAIYEDPPNPDFKAPVQCPRSTARPRAPTRWPARAR